MGSTVLMRNGSMTVLNCSGMDFPCLKIKTDDNGLWPATVSRAAIKKTNTLSLSPCKRYNYAKSVTLPIFFSFFSLHNPCRPVYTFAWPGQTPGQTIKGTTIIDR